MSEDVRRVSPTSLATYAKCPRQYEYDKVWDVETPEESRRYMDRGLAYHAAIETVCEAVSNHPDDPSDRWIQDRARDAVEESWREQTDRREYVSDAQYEYDRQLTISAIETFFESDGLKQARRSLAQELWVECDRDGIHLIGRADNLIRTDEGLQLIDYKGSLSNLVSGSSRQKLEPHAAGEEYAGDILSSVFQAAAYIEGIKQSEYFEPGMEVEFTFYGVLASKERTRHVDGIKVRAEGRARDVGWIYEAHEETIWDLMGAAYRGIMSEGYQPEPWDLIRENACEDCAYQAMCGDYLGEEVRVGD